MEATSIKRGMHVRALLPTGKYVEGKFLQHYQVQDNPFGSLITDDGHRFGALISNFSCLSGSTRKDKAVEVISKLEDQIKEIEDNLPNVSVKRAELNKRKIAALEERITKWRKFL